MNIKILEFIASKLPLIIFFVKYILIFFSREKWVALNQTLTRKQSLRRYLSVREHLKDAVELNPRGHP